MTDENGQKMSQPGVEPGSQAWKAYILTVGLPTQRLPRRLQVRIKTCLKLASFTAFEVVGPSSTVPRHAAVCYEMLCAAAVCKTRLGATKRLPVT